MTPPGPNSSSPQAQASARFESSASLSDALSSPGDEALFASVNQLLLPRLQASPGTGGAGPDRVVDAASASLDDLIGCGPTEAISRLGHWFGTTAQDVRDPGFFAHMDPPTLWVSWVAHLWAARLNQNLLHPDVAPGVRDLEQWVLGQLAPIWGMAAGQIVPGSTLATLTALWAARETCGAREVVASELAHLSIAKVARILGLSFRSVPADRQGRMVVEDLGSLDDAILVLTAGTTSLGSVDDLSVCGSAAWTHVDAAWAGPMALSPSRRSTLAGIERADSVSISAHKWLFQPKDSALVLFADPASLDEITTGAAYLASPNVGVMGSRGAAGTLSLALTIAAYGLDQLGAWVDQCLALADGFVSLIDAEPRLERHPASDCGVVLWRPVGVSVADLRIAHAFVSTTRVPPLGAEGRSGTGSNGQPGEGDEVWLRSVASHPFVDGPAVIRAVLDAVPHS